MQKAISETKRLFLYKTSSAMSPLESNIDCIKEDWGEPDQEEKVSYREPNLSRELAQYSQSVPKGFDTSQWKAVEIIQEFLQPKSTMLLGDAVNRIIQAFPESSWILTLPNQILIELAQQIPYNHQSQCKLATLVCLFGRGIGVRPGERIDEKKVRILNDYKIPLILSVRALARW
jgi:hypothetical protein